LDVPRVGDERVRGSPDRSSDRTNRRDARLAAAGLDPDTVSTIRGDYMLESGHCAAATPLAANDLIAIGCIQRDSLVEAVAA
jgi:hypothetical protein